MRPHLAHGRAAVLGALLQLAAATAAAAAVATVRLQVPASHVLPNPLALPPSTHATLSAAGASHRAPLGADNAFVFRNVSAGSYLADVHCATYVFAPLRLDVDEPAPDGAAPVVRAWETYRGNDWDNKGEALDGGSDAVAAFDVRVLGPKTYFSERSTFSVFSVLRSPMILLGLVSMAIFIGMPYLMDNMDPEMKAEFEERQKTYPMAALLSGGGGGGGQQSGNSVTNFDMAAFLAGSSSSGGGAAKNGNGGGTKNQAGRK